MCLANPVRIASIAVNPKPSTDRGWMSEGIGAARGHVRDRKRVRCSSRRAPCVLFSVEDIKRGATSTVSKPSVENNRLDEAPMFA